MNDPQDPRDEQLPSASGIADFLRTAAESLRAIVRDLARLNRFGLRAGESADLPRRIRARRIREALAAGHDGRNRCC